VILVSYILLCVLRSLFLHPSVRNKMWADFGRIASIMILCKAIALSPYNTQGLMGWWTLLPGPAPHCRPGMPSYAPASIKNIFINQGTMLGHALNCGDLIFSGHTGFLVIVMLLSEELWKAKRSFTRWLWRLFTLTTLLLFSVFCLAARKHYSGW
jgi:singapore isolate B (sub-type 7) whole genome shotgun sequence assembly, scaffold_1